MADKTEGVLAVLQRDGIQAAQFRSITGKGEFRFATESDDARAKVAELLAADEEYDAAKCAVIEAERKYLFRIFESDQVDPAYARMEAAKTRRATAIRAMRGEQPVG